MNEEEVKHYVNLDQAEHPHNEFRDCCEKLYEDSDVLMKFDNNNPVDWYEWRRSAEKGSKATYSSSGLEIDNTTYESLPNYGTYVRNPKRKPVAFGQTRINNLLDERSRSELIALAGITVANQEKEIHQIEDEIEELEQLSRTLYQSLDKLKNKIKKIKNFVVLNDGASDEEIECLQTWQELSSLDTLDAV